MHRADVVLTPVAGEEGEGEPEKMWTHQGGRLVSESVLDLNTTRRDTTAPNARAFVRTTIVCARTMTVLDAGDRKSRCHHLVPVSR